MTDACGRRGSETENNKSESHEEDFPSKFVDNMKFEYNGFLKR